MRVGGGEEIHDIPEGCIANTISFTSPRDACRLSVVSSMFKSAAESDALWERFLPEDYESIVARSSDPSLLLRCSSKKELYFSLCDRPILIDSGLKSFSLDKWSGKKCYMLSARDLTIVWGDTPTYWQWVPEPKCRFNEVAELVAVCWLEIRGKINTRMLSKQTLYTAYFVFQLTIRAHGIDFHPVEVSVGLVGGESCKKLVHFDSKQIQRKRNPFILRRRLFRRSRNMVLHVPPPIDEEVNNVNDHDGYIKERKDGLLEVELGDFFNKEGEDGELEMSVLEIEHGHWKAGLIVQGIEIRPKESK